MDSFVFHIFAVGAFCGIWGPHDPCPAYQQVPMVAYGPVIRAIEPGAQCGLYSLYAAARALNVDINFERLLDRRYIGSPRGSSAQELIDAARDNGLHARLHVGLDIGTLQHAERPLLLLCELSRQVEESKHWILYLGAKNGLANVYDAPRNVEPIPFALLQTIWTGTAIEIGKEPIGFRLQVLAGLRSLSSLWPAVLFCVGIMICHRRRRPTNPTTPMAFNSLLVQVAAVLAMTSAWGLLAIAYDRNQPAANQDVLAFLSCRSEIDLQPHVDDLPPGMTVVDCRLPFAFGRNHIPGAVNLPVDAGFNEWNDIVETLDRTAGVIVYCESDQCAWADRVAARLACEGFAAHVLEGGFRQYWKSIESEKLNSIKGR